MDVITIGDAMIAMCPEAKGPIIFCDTFKRKVGGAELNVAMGCARLGIKSGWISRLGNDDFGKYIIKTARGEGIDTSEVQLVDGYPTSVYFREVLADGSSRSFYYREKSPTSTMKCEDLNENYFKEAKALHITGVFPSFFIFLRSDQPSFPGIITSNIIRSKLSSSIASSPFIPSCTTVTS